MMSMHTIENTNIDILIKNCQQQNCQDNSNNCVLLTTGSFNPVHRSHLNNLHRVKNYLENHKRPMNVLAGYISPTHDDHVSRKLCQLAWIPGNIRCQLCQDAIDEEGIHSFSWISVSRGEIQFPDGFMNFDFITKNLRDFLNSRLVGSHKLLKYPLTVVYVCGLDHFNKCTRVISLGREENMSCAIVYRIDYDEKHIVKAGKASNIIYVPLTDERHNLIDISSTRIRQCFENSTTDAEQFTYSSVLKYMTDKHT